MRIIFILIAILIGVNQIFVNFRIGSISYERLLAFGFFFLFLKNYIHELKTNTFFRSFNIFIVVFALVQLVMNLKLSIINGVEFKPVLVGLIKSFSFIAFTFLILLLAKKDKKYLDYIIYTHIFIFVFALLQHPLSPIATIITDFKRILFGNIENEYVARKLLKQVTYIQYGISDRFRLSGPFPSTINLSYLLFTSFCLNIYMLYNYKKRFYLISAAFVLIISLLTQTRSLILAEGFIIIGLLAFNYSAKRNLYKIGLVILSFTFILGYFTKQYNSSNQARSTFDVNDNRPLLWYTGLVAVVKHPFGITQKQYNEVRNVMYVRFEDPYVKVLAPHNGLVNIGLNYTIIGYIIIILFLVFLIKNINYLDKQFKTIFLLFIFGYFMHISFHNTFIFIDDYNILIVVILLNLQLNRNKPNLIDE